MLLPMQEKMNKMKWTLYILKLEQGKWYVGITSKTVEHRFAQHKNGFGANWTRKYKPIEIFDTKDLGGCEIEKAQLFEGKVTREYMEKYGDNNVRGGDLTDLEDYKRHFGRFWHQDNWELVLYIIFMLLVLAVFFIDKYIVPFIPGGIR